MHNRLFEIFFGRWSFNKEVSTSNTTIIGTATFVEKGSRKVFKEQGVHSINGTTYPCHQSYIYEFRKRQIYIFKHTEELLHKFNIPSGSASFAQHAYACLRPRFIHMYFTYFDERQFSISLSNPRTKQKLYNVQRL